MNSINKEHEESITEQVSNAVHGTDKPMEIAHPGATPLLVMGSYPIILLIAISIALGYYTFFRSKSDSNPASSPTNQSSQGQTESAEKQLNP